MNRRLLTALTRGFGDQDQSGAGGKMWGRSQANIGGPALGKASPGGGGSSAGGLNDAGNQPPPKLSDTPNPSVIPSPSTGCTLSKSDGMGKSSNGSNNASKDFSPSVVSSPLQWSEPSVNPLNVTVLPSGDDDQQKTEGVVPGNSARLVGTGGGSERGSSVVASAGGTDGGAGASGDAYRGSNPAPVAQVLTSTEGEEGRGQTVRNGDGVNAGASGERVVISASNTNAADSSGKPHNEISEEASAGRDGTAAGVGEDISSGGSDKGVVFGDSARGCNAAKTVQAPAAPTVDSREAGNWKPKPRGDAGNEASGHADCDVRQGKSLIAGAGAEGETVNDAGVSSTVEKLKKQPVATRFGGRTRTP